MRIRDLHLLPKIRDSWSYIYLERCQIDQEAKAIAAHDVNGTTSIPIATLALLMLGPGTSITHAAIRTLADNGCSIVWVGEAGVRCYAQGLGKTRSARRLLRQAQLWSDPEQHLAVVRRMYQMRFPEPLDPDLTLQQIRGKEGVRVREAYADPVNRALSAANSCLYGISHAAILSAGYSPALGFIHTGKQLSFVYDVADLYKAELTIPAAFAAVAEDGPGLESRVRHKCRDLFHEQRLLARIVGDLQFVLNGDPNNVEQADDASNDDDDFAADEAAPGGLWDPDEGVVPGGIDHSVDLSDLSAKEGQADA